MGSNVGSARARQLLSLSVQCGCTRASFISRTCARRCGLFAEWERHLIEVRGRPFSRSANLGRGWRIVEHYHLLRLQGQNAIAVGLKVIQDSHPAAPCLLVMLPRPGRPCQSSPAALQMEHRQAGSGKQQANIHECSRTMNAGTGSNAVSPDAVLLGHGHAVNDPRQIGHLAPVGSHGACHCEGCAAGGVFSEAWQLRERVHCVWECGVVLCGKGLRSADMVLPWSEA